jgi:glucuronate isomerase
MEWQLNALSNMGLLSRFVGMVTDSRSFMSYPRHEYFRRVLCNLIGRDVENGEIPDDEMLLGPMIRNICYANAPQYLAIPDVVAGGEPPKGPSKRPNVTPNRRRRRSAVQ